MAPSFEFSIIRATPDQVRGETVNIGLVATTPEGPVIQIKEARKLRALTGHDWDEVLALYTERLGQQLSNCDSLAAAMKIKPAVSEIFTLSAPGTIRKGANLNKVLERLLATYVERPVLSVAERQEKINSELKKFFKDNEVLAAEGEPLDDNKVHAKYVVSTDKQIVADFAVKRKNIRVATTLDFRKNVSRPKVFEKGGTLWFARQEMGTDTGLFGVYAAGPEAEEKHRADLEVFREYAGGNVFNWMKARDRQRFALEFY